MSISPDGSLLATIEVSGRLSLWDVPSFRLRRAWNCEEQVSTWLMNFSTCLSAMLFPFLVEKNISVWYTVEPLYCGHLGDLVRCPV